MSPVNRWRALFAALGTVGLMIVGAATTTHDAGPALGALVGLASACIIAAIVGLLCTIDE